jgi:hypothetical protein
MFTVGLHKKPWDCGASVASAAGQFSAKKSYGHLKRSVLWRGIQSQFFVLRIGSVWAQVSWRTDLLSKEWYD